MTAPNTPRTAPQGNAELEPFEISFVIEGHVSDAARSRATHVVRDLATKAPRPVIFARVKLLQIPSRAPTENHMAQATLDVSGTLLRSQAAAAGMIDAINMLGERLERRLRDLAERREAANARPTGANSEVWKHGDLPSARPAYFPRPDGEREIVRRKTWAGHRISVMDALFDLYALDHRYFLFTDEVDGVDSIVFEAPGGMRLRRLTGGAPPAEEIADLPVEVVETPAPSMTSDDAARRLDTSDEPFVFYRDTATARGCVLYRRYDGHYGLIEATD